MRRFALRILPALLVPALLVLAGCGGNVAANPSGAALSISPGANVAIDTNCTGCNASSAQGGPVEQFSATMVGGGAATVTWSVSGGDPVSGAGNIGENGQYTPPSYLTTDRTQVTVTATSPLGWRATALLTVTPGFLQPLTPENVALGANGSVTILGTLAEAGGGAGIEFLLSSTAAGLSGGQGSLGATHCQRSNVAFTTCSVTYTAPAALSGTANTYVVATAGAASRVSAAVLLNTAGVTSNPAAHQAQLPTAVQLGSSGGNNRDYDASGNTIQDCCGGTLGSLVQDSGEHRYILSNNHVLARSDHAAVGDAIVQPGLIDNNCTPNGEGGGTTPVATLTAWLPLSSKLTNADAAIAQVTSRSVDPTGAILELGGRQPDGLLAPAPPGVSSSGGRGENPSLQMQVAKSGRTTGLTCASVAAVNVDVSVDYYQDCAETKPYLTKTFTNQMGISGNQFSDAGDSGSLVVDASNAEPVGLFFAGGLDASGVGQGVATPATDVLNELSAQSGGTSYSFVGGADHAVSCLNYGDNQVASAQARTLSEAEFARGQQALAQARTMINQRAGILGVALARSNDRPGEAALALYMDENSNAAVPATVGGVRTLAIPTTARAVAFGSAPQTPTLPGNWIGSAQFAQASAAKQQAVRNLMKRNPAFFGVGIGQSLDNPKEAALVIYVDRKHMPAQLPQTIGGVRTRYVVMDRLHVTRSYAAPIQAKMHCMPHRKQDDGWMGWLGARSRGLF